MNQIAPVVTILAVLLGTVSASHAQSQGPFSTPPAPEKEVAVSYHSSILAVSTASLGVALLGAALEGDGGRDTSASSAAYVAALGSFTFGGPIVHAVHGNGKGAFLSLAARIVIPGIAISVAMNTGCHDDPENLGEALCPLSRIGVGWLVGAAIAASVDAAFLAKTTERVRERPFVAPTLSATSDSLSLGMGGTF